MATEKEVFLYKITNPKGRIYIGQTVDPRKRFIVYARNDTKSQHRLKSSISKYGWEDHYTEIITSFSLAEIDYVEKYLIAYYNATGKNGLNILSGGQIRKTDEQNKLHSILMTGKKQSKEQIAKRSASLNGNQNAKGSVRSDEFKKNVSLKLTGIKRPNNPNYSKPKISARKPILCYNKNGELFKRYDYARDSAIDGFDPSCVFKVCDGKEGRTKHKGFTFKFENNGQRI